MSLVAPALTLLIAMLGGAMMWGSFRATLNGLTKEVSRLSASVEEHVKHTGALHTSFAALEAEVRTRFESAPAYRRRGSNNNSGRKPNGRA